MLQTTSFSQSARSSRVTSKRDQKQESNTGTARPSTFHPLKQFFPDIPALQVMSKTRTWKEPFDFIKSEKDLADTCITLYNILTAYCIKMNITQPKKEWTEEDELWKCLQWIIQQFTTVSVYPYVIQGSSPQNVHFLQYTESEVDESTRAIPFNYIYKFKATNPKLYHHIINIFNLISDQVGIEDWYSDYQINMMEWFEERTEEMESEIASFIEEHKANNYIDPEDFFMGLAEMYNDIDQRRDLKELYVSGAPLETSMDMNRKVTPKDVQAIRDYQPITDNEKEIKQWMLQVLEVLKEAKPIWEYRIPDSEQFEGVRLYELYLFCWSFDDDLCADIDMMVNSNWENGGAEVPFYTKAITTESPSILQKDNFIVPFVELLDQARELFYFNYGKTKQQNIQTNEDVGVL